MATSSAIIAAVLRVGWDEQLSTPTPKDADVRRMTLDLSPLIVANPEDLVRRIEEAARGWVLCDWTLHFDMPREPDLLQLNLDMWQPKRPKRRSKLSRVASRSRVSA